MALFLAAPELFDHDLRVDGFLNHCMYSSITVRHLSAQACSREERREGAMNRAIGVFVGEAARYVATLRLAWRGFAAAADEHEIDVDAFLPHRQHSHTPHHGDSHCAW